MCLRVDFLQKHCKSWVMRSISSIRSLAPSTNPVLERRAYGESAISAFRYQGVMPRLVMQHVKAALKAPDSAFEQYLKVSQGNKRVAHVLWTENQRRLQQDPRYIPDYYQVPLALDPESDEVKAFMHYTTQNLAKSKTTLPRWDNWNQVFYESNGGQSDLLPGVNIPRALASLTTNYEEVKALFLQHKEQIIEILETRNLVIISNHCTWLNLPLIVAFLHEVLEIPLNKINTILGGALTTQQAGFEVANASNLLKTVPDTPNGRLDEVAPEISTNLTRRFGRELVSKMKTPGGIYILSPGGTSDIVSEGKIDLLEASDGTKKLLKLLGKKNAIWPIATHSGAIYAKQNIQPGALRLSESGIILPGSDTTGLAALKRDVELLNNDRTVCVHSEEDFLQVA